MSRTDSQRPKRASPGRWRTGLWISGLALVAQIAAIALLLLIWRQGIIFTTTFYALAGVAGLTLVLHLVATVRFLWVGLSERHELTPAQQLIDQLGTEADPATAIFHAVGTLQQRLGVDRVALFATDGYGRYAELLAEAQEGGFAGALAGRLTLKHIPELETTIKEGLPLVWRDVRSHPLGRDSSHLLAADHPALALYPLFAGEGLVGFLALASSRSRRLSRLVRRSSLEAVAMVLGLYIHTAGLQPDVLRVQDQIELLYEVTTHLNTDLSLEKVMSNILYQALSKVGATRGSIFLLDEEGNVAHRILARENLAPEISNLTIKSIMDRGLAAWLLEHKRGTLVKDALQDERWLVLPDHAGQVRSAAAVPFLRGDEVQGMLFLTHPDVENFRQEHLDLLTSIANQAAIAIQNARLYAWAENERRTLAAVLDSSADAVLVIDPRGQVLLANRAARQALGIENRPAPLKELLYHSDLLEFLNQASLESGAVGENVSLGDGRTFSVNLAPVLDGEGRTIGRVAAMHDISHLIELDEMKSRFVSTVSHDLKAPLTAIRGFADLVETIGPLNEDQVQFIARIRSVADSMANLISDLLDLGKIEAGLGMELQPIDLREILISAKYDLAMAAQEKGIGVEVDVPTSLPLVEVDLWRIKQVMSNLLSNALKYTPAGGQVWIRATQKENEVVASIRDNGIGIPASDLPQVFEKFYRVKDARASDVEGTGLGLAIVKSIIEEHGGRVWAESTLNRGSTFYFSLPLMEQQSLAIPSAAPSVEEAPAADEHPVSNPDAAPEKSSPPEDAAGR